MSLRFDPASCVRAAILFVVLLLLATFGRDLGWIRSFLGDVLAVAWVYYIMRTVVAAKTSSIALFAFAIGAMVELTQYVMVHMDVEIPNPVLRVAFGATPDWWDVLAYAIGAVLVLGLDALRGERGITKQS
jgi:hypothetical protein